MRFPRAYKPVFNSEPQLRKAYLTFTTAGGPETETAFPEVEFRVDKPAKVPGDAKSRIEGSGTPEVATVVKRLHAQFPQAVPENMPFLPLRCLAKPRKPGPFHLDPSQEPPAYGAPPVYPSGTAAGQGASTAAARDAGTNLKQPERWTPGDLSFMWPLLTRRQRSSVVSPCSSEPGRGKEPAKSLQKRS